MHLTHGTRFSKKLVHFLLIILSATSLSCSASLPQVQEPREYQNWDADQKRDWIWQQVLNTRFCSNDLPTFESINLLTLAMGSMVTKMEHQSDFIPRRWAKPIHRRSVLAKVRYQPLVDHPFDGVFQEGSIGVLRASLTYAPESRGVAPGLALKIFRDQQVSLDASFLTSLDSQGQNYNFFAKTFSNIVPLSGSWGARVVSWIFRRGSEKTNFISVEHFAETKAPLQVFLKAPSNINFASSPARDIRLDFMGLKKDTVILEVYARLDEKFEEFEEMTPLKMRMFEQRTIKIGEIVLESSFVASSFSDDQLFFRHQRFRY